MRVDIATTHVPTRADPLKSLPLLQHAHLQAWRQVKQGGDAFNVVVSLLFFPVK